MALKEILTVGIDHFLAWGWTAEISCNNICYMKKDSKLSSILHVLLHMAHYNRPLTSEALAGFLSTNPVVVRRTLAGLRDAGYVDSTKGHGGGWVLVCDLQQITLRQIYEAVGAPPVFAMGNRMDEPRCLVERAVNHRLENTFQEVEALLLQRLDAITLADLAADFSHGYQAHCSGEHGHEH